MCACVCVFCQGLRMVDGSIDGFGDPQSLSSEQQQISREELERNLQEPSDQVRYTHNPKRSPLGWERLGFPASSIYLHFVQPL